jgi:hypothetical protein
MSPLNRILNQAFCILMLVCLSQAALAQESQQIFVGEMQLVPTPFKVKRVAVGNGKLMSTSILDSGELLVLGEKEGDTELRIWMENGQEIRRQFFITPLNASRTSSEAAEAMKNLLGVTTRRVGQNIVVEGDVSAQTAALIDKVIAKYADIINLTSAMSMDSAMELLAMVPGLQVRQLGRFLMLRGTYNQEGKTLLDLVKSVYPDMINMAALVDENGRVIQDNKPRPLGEVHLDANGQVVTADGTALAGVSLNEQGQLVLADGRVVDAKDVVLGADGQLRTQDGRILAGVSAGKPLGALQQDANGQVVTADGRVISGASLNAQGQLVLADGSVVNPADVVVSADGRLVNKEGKALPGVTSAQPLGELSLNDKGEVVTADGRVIQGAKLREDGRLVLADGQVVDPKQLLLNADGSVATPAKLQLEGAKLREDGQWELADGRVIDPTQVSIQADGTVVTQDGQVLEGIKAQRVPAQVISGLQVAGVKEANSQATRPLVFDIKFIPGGTSKDGLLPILKVQAGN